MQRDDAIAKLRQGEADLKMIGVRSLYLFGSTVRDEAKTSSDVDLFFDYDKGNFGLFELMDVKEKASTLLGCEADIMTRGSLHPLLRDGIEASAIRIF